MFKVECLGCQAPYQVDERRVPEKGLKMRCPKCGTTFKVEAPAATASSQPPAPAPSVAPAAAPAEPFTTSSAAPAAASGRLPTARDRLSRTMIGVSSAELEAAGASQAKAFRVPLPDAPARPASAPPSARELDLPAVGRPRALGLARGPANSDVALPELVKPRAAEPAWGLGRTAGAAAAPRPEAVESEEVADLPTVLRARSVGASEPAAAAGDAPPRPAPSAAPGEGQRRDEQRGVGAEPAGAALPMVAAAPVRPPPRRPRPRTPDPSESAELPARLDELEAALPAVIAPSVRPAVQRLARPAGAGFDALDLPATAERRTPAGPPRPAPSEPPLTLDDAEVELPSVAREARPRPHLSGADLPAIGRPSGRAERPEARAPSVADLPSVARPAGPGLSDDDLPAVGAGQPTSGDARLPRVSESDLPGADGRDLFGEIELPAQLGGTVPVVPPPRASAARARALEERLDAASVDTGLPEVLGRPRQGSSAGLPGVSRASWSEVSGTGLPEGSGAGLPEVFGTGLPEVFGTGLPEVSGTGLPRVSGAGLPEVSGTGLPEVFGTGLPQVSGTGLPDVLGLDLPDNPPTGLPNVVAAGLPEVSGTGLPDVQPAGLPDVLATGLPDVLATGLPDVLAAGLPAMGDVALPEVLAPGVSGFGRVELPVAKPAELPEVRSGRFDFEDVDLPGVGEALPSIAEQWGEANLPTVGDALPLPKGAAFDQPETPFGAFDPPGEVDPFAGAEADFGAPDDGADPFAPSAPFGADDGATLRGADEGDGPRSAAGYGEVDIAGVENEEVPLETADDMEFGAIPQGGSGAPARAAASASVHAEGPDADATGSTLELGPERRAPQRRKRRLLAIAAACLATIAGGALALEPAIGPFGLHFALDQLERGEHERQLAELTTKVTEAERLDTFEALLPELNALERARASAPRFGPLGARSALEHYQAVLRYGPLPNLEAVAKAALEPLDRQSEDPGERLALAASDALARRPEAKSRLEALGAVPDARELLAELALRERDFAGAARAWRELAKAEPGSARALFGVARAELGLGNFEEAAAWARRTLEQSPEHAGAPVTLLEAQRARQAGANGGAGSGESVEALVAGVLRALPDAAPGEAAIAHCVLGELHASQGRAQPAQQAFEAALVIDRSMPRALIGLGEVLHQADRHSEALARFEAAAHADPGSIAAQIGVAKSQVLLSRVSEAMAVLARLPAEHKARADVIYWRAKAEQALGQHDAAMATFRAAIAAGQGRADSVEAYLGLAKLQADLGQLALAEATLSEARSKLPPSGPLHQALGDIEMSRADYAGAHAHFERALELDPDNTRARFAGAVALTRLGRFEEALEAFRVVAQMDKSFPGLAVERGRLFEQSGRSAEALEEYESALKQTPDDPDVQIRVACARVIAGQAPAASAMLEQVLKARPRSAEANYCLGRSLFAQERYLDAMTRLTRAIGIDPSRAVYHLYAGWAATELGRLGEALAALDAAIELDRGIAEAYWLRGRLRLMQGAARDAIFDLEQARKLSPRLTDAIADLAVAHSDTGRTAKALQLWDEAIGREPDNATWHFRYGKLLSAAGHGRMAAAHLERALTLVAEADAAAAPGTRPKPPVWVWQAHYLIGRELGAIPAAIPHWQAYLRLAPHDDPYRSEAERALRQLGQPWASR